MSSQKEYSLNVTYLLQALKNTKKIILENNIINFNSDLEFLENELHLSKKNAKKEILFIYKESVMFSKYQKEIDLIEDISKDILDNYHPDDMYSLSSNEFFIFFIKKYN